MTFQSLRLYTALSIVALYMTLEAAFMLVRVPPGTISAVPTGELLLIGFILTAVLDAHRFEPFLRTVPAAPLAIWWLVGGTQLAIGFSAYGFWAMRDATALVESLFLWVGFVVAGVPGAIPLIMRWFRWTVMAGVLIALTFPFREYILAVSPVIISANMREIPLFFTYQLAPITALAGGFWLLLSDQRIGWFRVAWLGGLIFVFVAALFQARLIYLQILLMFAILAFTQRGRLSTLFAPMAAAAGVFVLILALGVPIPGRISENVSLSFYVEHFLAITGAGADNYGGDEALRGAAGGVGQRIDWWGAIWENVTATWTRTMFGLGYGISLVGLANDTSIDAAVREPHNSLVSALGRLGFVGLISYIWLHAALAWIGVKTLRAYSMAGFGRVAEFVYVLGVFFLLLWLSAMGEDAFEKPFVAIPYYFYYGVILNLWYRHQNSASVQS